MGVRVGIVGGGLAGLAAAEGLSRHPIEVVLFEARRQLGGRAGSFCDPGTGQWIDHCQHVGMACCTNLIAFCRQAGIEHYLRRDPVLHFFGPSGRRCDLGATRLLPAPLHLVPSLLRLDYLSLREKWTLARAMLRLARLEPQQAERVQIGSWLRTAGQSQRLIDRFWSVVLVSALGEEIDRLSAAAARKVLVDGFLATRQAYELLVPTVSLGELYDHHVAHGLSRRGVSIRVGARVDQLEGDARRLTGLRLDGELRYPFDFLILAVPWHRVSPLLPEGVARAVGGLERLREINAAPITGVHLWFDRPVTDVRHAVLVGRLSQWLFHRGQQAAAGGTSQWHYYQVVISASRGLAGRDRKDIVQEVCADLRSVWPASAEARLCQWRVVTQRDAVFSMTPGIDQLRPVQRTAVANLLLAGDWTRTGWPATMEGAVRSGYLAAEAILEQLGIHERLVAPDLRPGFLARLL